MNECNSPAVLHSPTSPDDDAAVSTPDDPVPDLKTSASLTDTDETMDDEPPPGFCWTRLTDFQGWCVPNTLNNMWTNVLWQCRCKSCATCNPIWYSDGTYRYVVTLSWIYILIVHHLVTNFLLLFSSFCFGAIGRQDISSYIATCTNHFI